MSRSSKPKLLGVVLVLAVAVPFGAAADGTDPAAAVGAGPGSPVLHSWGSNLCGFAMMLATIDPSFRPSAQMICARITDPSDG